MFQEEADDFGMTSFLGTEQRLTDEDRAREAEIRSKVEKRKSKRKRRDELLKISFRRGFKFLQAKFYQFQKRKLRRNRKLDEFYYHYFGRLSSDLTAFHNPDHRKVKSQFKSFSISYIRQLLASRLYRSEMKKYLLQDFAGEMRDKQMQVLQSQGELTRLKAPWDEEEVRQAQEQALRLLQEYEEDCLSAAESKSCNDKPRVKLK